LHTGYYELFYFVASHYAGSWEIVRGSVQFVLGLSICFARNQTECTGMKRVHVKDKNHVILAAGSKGNHVTYALFITTHLTNSSKQWSISILDYLPLNLNSVNQLISVMVKCAVLFEVRTEFLNNI
jgi:hypothetical protein